MKIDIKGIKSQRRLFHNVHVDVYPKDVTFEEIQYWPENFRTILDFNILETQKKKAIKDISLEEITDFLVDRYDLHLVELANSIEKNGVRVPLTIIDDGTLLDGNRRYFACSYIFYKAKRKKQAIPDTLMKIPAMVIKAEEVDDRLRQKILAEANFVSDYKVPWTLDVKAKVINGYYQLCINNGLTSQQAYDEIEDVYGVNKSDVEAYVETVELTEQFIGSAQRERRNQFRELVQGRFVYFWEFRNKALKGRAPLDTKKELPQVKSLFFKMIETQRFKNMKQVEPMIKAVRDKDLWALLSDSKGSKIDVVEALYKEAKVIKSAEDKIRNFLKWLQTKADLTTFTTAAFKLLEQLVGEASNLLKRRKKS